MERGSIPQPGSYHEEDGGSLWTGQDWIQQFCGREGLNREWLNGGHPSASLVNCLGGNSLLYQ